MIASITNLSAQQLRRAAKIKEKIQSLEDKLALILGIEKHPVVAVIQLKKRKMSASARRKIGAAQKARWAKVRAENESK